MIETDSSDASSDTTSSTQELIADTPTARPSSPSMRLTALVHRTIQKMVMTAPLRLLISI